VRVNAQWAMGNRKFCGLFVIFITMGTKNIILLLLTFLFVSSQCKKDKLPAAILPPVTQEGKNTVGFTLNGEVWVPYYKCCWSCDPCGEMSANYGPPSAAPNSFDLQITRQRGDKTSDLTISSSGVGTITNMGNKIDSILISYRDENANGNNGDYFGPLPGSKFLINKIDFQNQIISGEFEFILLEQNGSGKEITLKDGRFDFKFNACKCSN